MTAVVCRPLGPADERAFMEGAYLWQGEDPTWYSFCWKPGMAYSQMLWILAKESQGLDMEPGRVPHTMLYAFHDGKIIGRVSIRHELNRDLLQRGGNLGYSVAPQFRRQGFATEMLRQGLDFCRTQLHLKKALITCAETNIASIKLIEKYAGKLENTVVDPQTSEKVARYWIAL